MRDHTHVEIERLRQSLRERSARIYELDSKIDHVIDILLDASFITEREAELLKEDHT